MNREHHINRQAGKVHSNGTIGYIGYNVKHHNNYLEKSITEAVIPVALAFCAHLAGII